MKRVLIIDDSPSIIAVLEHLFKSSGFEVVLAEDGEKGMEAVTAGSFDLVLTDANLPGIDGFEVCKQVKEINSSLKVVIMTGTINQEVKMKAAKCRADELVDKSQNIGKVLELSKMILET